MTTIEVAMSDLVGDKIWPGCRCKNCLTATAIEAKDKELAALRAAYSCASELLREAEARAETAERELKQVTAERDELHLQFTHLCQEFDVRNDELRTAERERDQARAALKPFADVAEHDIGGSETDDDYFRPMTIHNHAPRLTVGHFRRAARAIAGEQQ